MQWGALTLTGLLALACGSEVTTTGTTGAGGSGGSGGAGGSGSVSSSSASTSVSATDASSSTGPVGTPCEQACAKIETCGFGTCQQFGINCGDPQYDCVGECLVDATCADIIALAQGNGPPEIQACVSGCQGGGQGGGGQGGACGQCIFQSNCAGGCMNDPACQAWGQCALNCSTPDCYADCNTQFPEAAMQYGAIYECACSSCATDCEATMDPCNQGSGSGGAGAGGAGMGGAGMGGAGGMGMGMGGMP
jgi:hypothetical protein